MRDRDAIYGDVFRRPVASMGISEVIASPSSPWQKSQSAQELALRMALGAATSDLLRLVMAKGLALTACGMLFGVAAALELTGLMGYLLYKVSPRDPLAFGFALVVIAVAALAACFVPAWRATRTDPLRALRG